MEENQLLKTIQLLGHGTKEVDNYPTEGMDEVTR